ncbi:MAG: EF-hand domain-containing protein [Opitutales bacterium]
MKKTSIHTCLLAVLLIPAATQAMPGKGPQQFDTNGDGKVTRSEAAEAPRLLEHFDRIDSDGDGQITRAEMKAARQQRQDGSGRSPNKPNLTPDERQAFRGQTGKKTKPDKAKIHQADTDGNRALSRDEAAAAGMNRLLEHFDRIDSDGDGQITRAEMKAARQQLRQKRRDGSSRSQNKQTI